MDLSALGPLLVVILTGDRSVLAWRDRDLAGQLIHQEEGDEHHD